MLSVSAVIAALATSVSLLLHPFKSVVNVTTTEFAFAAPASIPAGTTLFHFVNRGKELHHVAVIRLENGKTLADYTSAMKKPGPPPAWAVDAGGPNAAAPGHSADAILTLTPGNYLLVCFIPSPGEQAPHVMKGMVKALTVTPSANGSVEPKSDIDLTLSDYKFALSKPLTAGHHLLHVVNTAAQSHEFLLVKLAPGKTAADVAKWVEAGMHGAPPGMPLGGTTQIARGRTITVPVDLEEGRYGLICFIPDAKDGKPHSAHGMTETVTVGKA
ncbi:MAG TPA: hypothetical protein VGG84_07465 [Gemmatimonadaceae bacterium]|jgi:plastocyanin